MMTLKYLLTTLSFCLAISGFCLEFKYTKPVKALVKVAIEENKYCVTGVFERETRFSASFNRARERKYVRLLAENALLRFLKAREKIDSIEISGAEISSNLVEAKPNEKIWFRYLVSASAVKPGVRLNPKPASGKLSATPEESSPAPSESKSVDNEGNKVKQDGQEEDKISFEIASPETVFDSSWTLLGHAESESRQNINRITSDFEKMKNSMPAK